MSSETSEAAVARCTLCPAGCPLTLAEGPAAGPDTWRVEYPLEAGGGLCPRGSALGELLSHRRRILSARRRKGGAAREISLEAAARGILQVAGEKGIMILLDGNLPCEQLAEAAAWVRNWPDGSAGICFALEPSDEQMLLGIEASEAAYLATDEISQCDGYLIIGDVFAANPVCARGVLDRRTSEPKTPMVVIDSAAGKAAKFATHRVETPGGAVHDVLATVAASAKADVEAPAGPEFPSAAAAGQAIASCQRLGVIIAAEYGRSAAWRRVGYLAGRIAKARGGGVAPQTVGLNALAAVRLAAKVGAVSLAEAVADEARPLVVIGCDLLGMLGRENANVVAAAAALANRTTDSAPFVLPVPIPGECGGSYLFAGKGLQKVQPLLSAPAGVPTGGELVAAIAAAAGAKKPGPVALPDIEGPLKAEVPAAAPAWSDPSAPVLLLGRQSAESGCGELTSYASWQAATQPMPEARISAADARQMKLENLSTATVEAGGASLAVRIRVCPKLPAGRVVLPEASPQARALNPCTIQRDTGALSAVPVTVSVSG